MVVLSLPVSHLVRSQARSYMETFLNELYNNCTTNEWYKAALVVRLPDTYCSSARYCF